MVSQGFLYSLVVMVRSVKVTVAWLILLFSFFFSLLDDIREVQKRSLSEGNKLTFLEKSKSKAE